MSQHFLIVATLCLAGEISFRCLTLQIAIAAQHGQLDNRESHPSVPVLLFVMLQKFSSSEVIVSHLFFFPLSFIIFHASSTFSLQ